MQLKLFAKNKSLNAYTPTWIKFIFSENNKEGVLVLDIQGKTNCGNKFLDTCTNGRLIPWIFEDANGEIYDIYGIPSTLEIFSTKKIIEIIEKSSKVKVGVKPYDSISKKDFLGKFNDKFEEGMGFLEILDEENKKFKKSFKFEVILKI